MSSNCTKGEFFKVFGDAIVESHVKGYERSSDWAGFEISDLRFQRQNLKVES